VRDGRTITAAEAEQYLGIPASTIRAWAATSTRRIREDVQARGAASVLDDHTRLSRPLFAVGVMEDGAVVYRLSDVLALAEERKPVRAHTRPCAWAR